jgi:dipeptidyl aminopeptidase/acylaminoacyl peptidase
MTEGVYMEQSGLPRPIEPEDHFRFSFLQDAKLSPDGNSIVYVVSHTENIGKEDEKDVSALHLLVVDTGVNRQLTSGEAVDSSPDWSPDGKRIAFLSTRSGKPQIYQIPIDGGEAMPLTELEQGAGSGPVWSPDGKTIVFSAGPVKPVDHTRPYRVSRHIYRFNGLGYLDNAQQDLYLISSQGGAPRLLVHNTCVNSAPAWSPDGSEILYLVSQFPDSYRFLPKIYIVDLNGESRPLIDQWGDAYAAAWTPDGKQVAFLGMPLGRLVGSKADLWVIDRTGGQPECRTDKLKLHPGMNLQADMPVELTDKPQLVLGEDGFAYLSVQEGGRQPIYRIALRGAQSWSPIVTGERACLPLGLHQDRLLFVSSSLKNPLDIYVVKSDGSQERPLTQLNAALLSGLLEPQIQPLQFTAVDGTGLEGWYLKPVSGNPPYPTILYIHGGPHSGWGHIFSFDFQMLAGARYGVLLVNQRGSTGYGDEFANQIIGDWGNLDYRDLMSGVDYAIQQGLADPDRLGVCGLSGGGNLTCWTVAHTGRFKAAVPENPVTNWVSMYGVSDISAWFACEELGGKPYEIPEVYARCAPISYAHHCKTPTLLVQGEADYRCPAEQSEQFYTVLKANGCTVEMLRLPDSSHMGSITGPTYIRRAQNMALLEWMNRYILGKSQEKTP